MTVLGGILSYIEGADPEKIAGATDLRTGRSTMP